ncbi:MAG TPA: M48 family metallopeptidase, partial [Vicinamibacterales bacterium]|nr:M48 family metallopeptidase [Vicinamibacterales bacterium]
RNNVKGAVTAVAAMSLVLATAAWAQDGRTALKPGWNMFSPQQDIEVGQQVSPDAERQLPMLNNSRVDDYLNTLGRRLAAKAPGEKYPYRFKVVNDRAINAFALPGGPIYINRGVIEAADNESQLAGVVAHETAHVALRHGTNQASKASAAQIPLAILGGLLSTNSTRTALTQLGANFAVNSVLLKYSRTAESQADIMATQILHDSGYDPRAMAQFFQKIEAEEHGSGPVEFFSNHPSPDNRIERVNQEVKALGGARRDATTNSREFDEIQRYVRSLAGPPVKGQLQAGEDGRQPVASELRILSASYGAGDRFTDVRQRLQSRVQNERLDLKVNTSSMGSDPSRGQAKTLRLRYDWAGRSYDVTVADNQRLLIPTDQQVSAAADGTGTITDWPSSRFVSVENSLLRINHPDDWQTHGQGDAMTITPRGGLIDDGQGSQAMAYGVIVNIFEPRGDRVGQQLQGPGAGQGGGQDSAMRLVEQSTDQLVQELRLSNRNMRVIRYREAIRVDGDRALSTYLSNDSPLGGRETVWLVTVERPDDALLFIVFTAPERDVQRYEGTFHQMLRSVRIKR